MPSPLQALLDPVSLSIIGIYLTLILWEALLPARPLPRIPYWKLKGVLAFFFYFYLSTYFPLIYEKWLPSSQLFDLSGIPVVTAAGLGILLYEMGVYFWHRSMHKNHVLWRVFHQMHHSAERLDSYGAFFFSPFDMIGFTLLGTVCFSFILHSDVSHHGN